MSVEPEELMSITNKVLRLLGVRDYSNLELTGAFKTAKSWNVNFSYTLKSWLTKKVGCFSVSIFNGEITGMWLDRTWK